MTAAAKFVCFEDEKFVRILVDLALPVPVLKFSFITDCSCLSLTPFTIIVVVFVFLALCSYIVWHFSFVEVPVLVRLHLAESQHRVLALAAVIVRLLPVVRAAGDGALLRRGVLLEPRGHDRVQLLVLSPVSHHLVGVGAEILALQTVEVARTLGRFAGQRRCKNRTWLNHYSA